MGWPFSRGGIGFRNRNPVGAGCRVSSCYSEGGWGAVRKGGPRGAVGAETGGQKRRRRVRLRAMTAQDMMPMKPAMAMT